MKKNAIITFDYEVFLGIDTGNLENSVLGPTRRIIEILRQHNAKAIFFTDATWLLFLKENFPEDFQLVSEQLKEIVSSGSSVELHLHPHWKAARKNGTKIEFTSFENYRLHSLPQDEMIDLFIKSVSLLESITNQKIRCFRAGGWCIDPFSYLKQAFEICGIRYDFSVIPGMHQLKGNEFDFDFSAAPPLPFYRFQNDVQVPDPEGVFIEIPISSYQNNPFYQITNKVQLLLKNDKTFGDGKFIKKDSYGFLSSLFRMAKFPKYFLTIDGMNNRLFKFILHSHFKKSDLLVLISHPKIVSEEALLNLTSFVKTYNTLNSPDLPDLGFELNYNLQAEPVISETTFS
jgi:hypothetical protein